MHLTDDHGVLHVRCAECGDPVTESTTTFPVAGGVSSLVETMSPCGHATECTLLTVEQSRAAAELDDIGRARARVPAWSYGLDFAINAALFGFAAVVLLVWGLRGPWDAAQLWNVAVLGVCAAHGLQTWRLWRLQTACESAMRRLGPHTGWEWK